MKLEEVYEFMENLEIVSMATVEEKQPQAGEQKEDSKGNHYLTSAPAEL